MEIADPFLYPPAPHRRRHWPRGYANYQDYKPWLRDEFSFRCAYCLSREVWFPDRSAAFSVDHVIPRSRAPSRELDYTNLVYSCLRCNSAKSDGVVLDPTEVALSDHLEVAEDGRVQGLTIAGTETARRLRLNTREAAVQERLFIRSLLTLRRQNAENAELGELFLLRFGYPGDMPDLRRLRPPGGNASAGSEHDCFHARWQRGELAEVY